MCVSILLWFKALGKEYNFLLIINEPTEKSLSRYQLLNLREHLSIVPYMKGE